MTYVVHVSRGQDNVATNELSAGSDEQACDLAKEWAASLNLDKEDDLLLWIKLKDGRIRTFSRGEF